MASCDTGKAEDFAQSKASAPFAISQKRDNDAAHVSVTGLSGEFVGVVTMSAHDTVSTLVQAIYNNKWADCRRCSVALVYGRSALPLEARLCNIAEPPYALEVQLLIQAISKMPAEDGQKHISATYWGTIPGMAAAVRRGAPAAELRAIATSYGGQVVGAANQYGGTLLHYAATQPSLENVASITSLIEEGEDVNIKEAQRPGSPPGNGSGFTPLHWAASAGCIASAAELLYQGADLNLKNMAGETPAQVAQRCRKAEEWRMAVENFQSRCAIDGEVHIAVHAFGRTPGMPAKDGYLHISETFWGQVPGLADAVARGAGASELRNIAAPYGGQVVGAANKYGGTLLHFAATQHLTNVASISSLISEGEHVNDQEDERPGDENGSGFTPLHWAASIGCSVSILELLRHGADLNSHNFAGETPAQVAHRSCKADEWQLAVESQAQNSACNLGRED